MLRKWINYIFIAVFLIMIGLPLLLTKWDSGGVSTDENRNLSPFPVLFVEGEWNADFTSAFEDWFMDHMGLRQKLIVANARMQYRLFDRLISNSNYHIGPNGDINYATLSMIQDYAHTNLRTEEEVQTIGESYQVVSDWLEDQGIPFYYVQCYDKHSIYPEHFTDKINQFGNISKTDQVISYLENNTTVNVISLKEPLLQAKSEYEVYSNWGDPTHWTQRGAYIGYRTVMDRINTDFSGMFPVLQESDYKIGQYNAGITLNQVIHQDDYVEYFGILNPKAVQLDTELMGEWGEDERHSIWKNTDVDNDTRLLLVCDSYIEHYIIEDFAESFSEIWLIWGDYTPSMQRMVSDCQPDLVIYEAAERVDRSGGICRLAEKIRNSK